MEDDLAKGILGLLTEGWREVRREGGGPRLIRIRQWAYDVLADYKANQDWDVIGRRPRRDDRLFFKRIPLEVGPRLEFVV